jgi:hypothetical protein
VGQPKTNQKLHTGILERKIRHGMQTHSRKCRHATRAVGRINRDQTAKGRHPQDSNEHATRHPALDPQFQIIAMRVQPPAL